jgi:signal transduction histidine kinase
MDAAPVGLPLVMLGERETPIPIHRDGELVSVITHDLRQPLTAAELNVAAALHYLQRRDPLAGEAIAALVDAQGQQRRLRDSIRALHALSEHREAFFTGIDAVAIVWDVVRLAATDAMAHGVPTQLVVFPPVPPVAVDAVRMREALMDISQGALDALTPGAAQQQSVTFEVRPAGLAVEIAVTHTGSPPSTALIERWTDAVARSVDGDHAATITVEHDIGKDVRIVTRWPAGAEPDIRRVTSDASLPLTQ